jgi:hypothetical protein
VGKKVEDLFPELEELIQYRDKHFVKVSDKTIGWQLDHSLKVLNSICKLLEKSDSSEFKSNFNLSRVGIFATGWIPRGVGKAPRVVTSTDVSEEELISQFKEAKESLAKIQDLPENSFFKHVVLGPLNLQQSKKFMYIHTYHHLKIMRDILKG